MSTRVAEFKEVGILVRRLGAVGAPPAMKLNNHLVCAAGRETYLAEPVDFREFGDYRADVNQHQHPKDDLRNHDRGSLAARPPQCAQHPNGDVRHRRGSTIQIRRLAAEGVEFELSGDFLKSSR
jgi:hypothetical protein